VSQTPQGVRVPELNPFLAAPLIEGTSTWCSRRLLWLFPLCAAPAFLAAAVHGTVGNPDHFSLISDVRQVLDAPGTTVTYSEYPLLRDYPSGFLMVIVVLTCVLVHHQWALMKACLPELESARVVAPSADPTASVTLKLLTRRFSAGQDQFGAVVVSVNRFFSFVGRANVLVGFAAIVLMTFVVVTAERNGIFQVLVPRGAGRVERGQLLRSLYGSWWASTDHLFGALVYGAIGVLGIYVILMQNIVGAACVAVISWMPRLLDMRLDWSRPHEAYGWLPLTRVFRTVLLSLALHALGLSMLLLVLGVENFLWIGVLVVIWPVGVAAYTLHPWIVFRRFVARARHEKLDEIVEATHSALASASPTERHQIEMTGRASIREVQQARIRLLVNSPLGASGFVVTVVMPVLLTVAQIADPF
jgi:hypothetical protein